MMTIEEAASYLVCEYAVSQIELDDLDWLATLRARWASYGESQDRTAMEALDVLELEQRLRHDDHGANNPRIIQLLRDLFQRQSDCIQRQSDRLDAVYSERDAVRAECERLRAWVAELEATKPQPFKWTAEAAQAKILDLLATGLSLNAVYKALPISRRQVMELRKADPEFDSAVKGATARTLD